LPPALQSLIGQFSDPDYVKTWSKLTPVGSPANVEDIAAAAAFLVSEAARHITGQTLIIDGGWTPLALPLMDENSPSSTAAPKFYHQAPAPWHLEGEGIIVVYKFSKKWVETFGQLPPELMGKFKGGLGYLMLV